VLAVIIEIVSDIIASARGLWEYSDLMPIIPLLNVGLIPALAFLVTIPLTFLMTSLVTRENNKCINPIIEDNIEQCPEGYVIISDTNGSVCIPTIDEIHENL
jgi:hypothetical protein